MKNGATQTTINIEIRAKLLQLLSTEAVKGKRPILSASFIPGF